MMETKQLTAADGQLSPPITEADWAATANETQPKPKSGTGLASACPGLAANCAKLHLSVALYEPLHEHNHRPTSPDSSLAFALCRARCIRSVDQPGHPSRAVNPAGPSSQSSVSFPTPPLRQVALRSPPGRRRRTRAPVSRSTIDVRPLEHVCESARRPWDEGRPWSWGHARVTSKKKAPVTNALGQQRRSLRSLDRWVTHAVSTARSVFGFCLFARRPLVTALPHSISLPLSLSTH